MQELEAESRSDLDIAILGKEERFALVRMCARPPGDLVAACRECIGEHPGPHPSGVWQ
jgi:hypothetical protein